MKKTGAIVVALLCCVLAIAQSSVSAIEITGKLTGQIDTIPKTIRLTHYQQNGLLTKDVEVDSNGIFVYNGAITAATTMSVILPDSYFTMIVTPNEKVYRVNVTMQRNTPVKLDVPGSTENEAYSMFSALADNYHEKLETYLLNPEKESNIAEQTSSFYKQLQKIAATYKGTYTADVLTHAFFVNAPSKTVDTDFIKTNLLNTLAFNNTAFYNSTYPTDLFLIYSSHFLKDNYVQAGAFYTDFIGGVTDSIARTRLHELLYNTYYNRQLEKELSNYADWANANPGMVNNLYVKHQLSLLAKILCGKKAPDVTEKNENGEFVTLQQTAKKNKVTLLTIWSATCDHCRHDIPQLKPLYEKYHAQGFEIFSVAVNSTEAEWKQFSQKQGFKWLNTYHPANTPYGSLTDYMITNIPAFIAVDHNGIILKRYVKLEQIEDLIK